MNKKLEEVALEAYNDMFHNPEKMSVHSTCSLEEAKEMGFDYKEPFKNFFMLVYQQGYSQANKDFILVLDQIKSDLQHRHELYSIQLQMYPDPNDKHTIDLIARMREVTSLMIYIDNLKDDKRGSNRGIEKESRVP